MSGRGGRGGVAARGQPSYGRGGGGGRGGAPGRDGQGRGRGSPSYSGAPQTASSLSGEFGRKLSFQPSPSVPSAWARPGSSSSAAPPQPAPAAQVTPSVQAPAPPLVQPAEEEQPQQVVPVVPPASQKAVRHAVRPGYGSFGRKCLVKANHFLVNVANRDLHHYDVAITPDITSKKVCRNIIAQLVHIYKDSDLGGKLLAFDGRKSAYSAGSLPFDSKDFMIQIVDGSRKERKFEVKIKFAAKADLRHLQQFLLSRQLDAPQKTIQALDVVLRAKPSTDYEVVGRSFFSPSLGEVDELGSGTEYWRGFYQSLRPTQMGLSLNIDMSARAFYQPILVTDFVGKFFNRDPGPLSDQDRLRIKKVLKGVIVEVDHQGFAKRYKVTGLSALPTAQLTFPVDKYGTQKSVVQYFREKYNILLRYTFLPALQAGNNAKPVMLPMEVCTIVEGQRYSRKLNERQVTELLKATCQRPAAREQSIWEMVKRNNYNGVDLVNNEFGIQVMSELTTVEARVLDPPMLKYHESGRETHVDPRVGQWNMIDKKMVNGAKVEFWTCVSFSRYDGGLDKFCRELINMCRSKGMDFNPTPLLPITKLNAAQIEKGLSDIHKQSAARLASTGHDGKSLQLLIVVLPDITGSYGRIKRICETELGIVSQCCQPRQAAKCNKQYLENVALKINVKAGGRNTVLEQAIQRKIHFLTDRPTIVFGADVTHPQPGEDSSPSIAAVVASMDWPEVTKYRGLVSAQPHRVEIIHDLYSLHEDPKGAKVHGGMIRELLIKFRVSTGRKPERIIFYRDGVSEGQFDTVLLSEMDAIRNACVSLQEDYLPRVTFIVVQKRHHTRLFPVKHGDRHTTDRSGNILPGTVVDKKICHPTEFDFYLCSHAGIQGTSRPAHYHVLYDENAFTADALQSLTNNLCYTYARCTRSVSIVPPAYYAHLAAFRARYYIEGDFSETGSSTSAGAARPTRERSKEVRPLPAIKDNVKDVMFYC